MMMNRFGPVAIVLAAIAIFVVMVFTLALFGYEIQRDSPFEVDCNAEDGVYFISKSNEEYCAKREFFITP